MKIQLCFRVADDAHNSMVLAKLEEVKGKLEATGEDYTVMSCHLNRQVLEEKGWGTMIIDGLENIFGDRYINKCTATTMAEALANMNVYRAETANEVDNIFIIGEQSVGNIALEVELFTNKKIQFFN